LNIRDIIQQLIKITNQSFGNIREKKIYNLTPIEDVSEGPTPPHEPEFSFLVAKQSPKGSKFSFDDMMTVVVSEALYPFYLKLPSKEFTMRFNKSLYDYIASKLEESRSKNVPDKNNIWMQPNAAFVNWFHEQSIEIDSVKSFIEVDKPKLENKLIWRDHSIAFVKAENSVPFVRLISPNIKDGSLKHPYDWGLYRSQSEPNKVYEMLLLFATRGKNLNPLDYSDIDQNTFSQRINRCNQWLMKIFNLNEKPIQRYSKKRVGYSSRIKITYQERKKGKDGLDFTDSNYDNPDLPTTETDNYRDNTDDFESDDYLNK